MKSGLALVVSLLPLSFVVLSCSDKRCVCPPSPNVRVTGQVLGYLCGIRDMWNNAGLDPRYTVQTGRKAIVKFIRLNGLTFAVETTDSSDFEVLVDPGAYTLVLETEHTYPDTVYNLQLTSDTLIMLETVYDYLDPDHIVFKFSYQNLEDSLQEAVERSHIHHVDMRIGGMFHAYEAERTVYISFNTKKYVSYRTPIVKKYAVWQVYEAASRYMYMWMASGHLPEGFSLRSLGYICLD